jgi:hypothetical protein
MHIWDCFFFEGFRILFQIGAAIFKMFSNEIMKADEVRISALLKEEPKKITKFSKFLKLALTLGGFFDESEFIEM